MHWLQVFLLTIHTTATAFQHDPPIFAVGEVRRNLCTWRFSFKMKSNVYFHQQSTDSRLLTAVTPLTTVLSWFVVLWATELQPCCNLFKQRLAWTKTIVQSSQTMQGISLLTLSSWFSEEVWTGFESLWCQRKSQLLTKRDLKFTKYCLSKYYLNTQAQLCIMFECQSHSCEFFSSKLTRFIPKCKSYAKLDHSWKQENHRYEGFAALLHRTCLIGWLVIALDYEIGKRA